MLNYLIEPRKRVERDFFDDFFAPGFFNGNSSTVRTDITETEKEYVLEVELPGYKKEDVKISLNEGYLKIEATKKRENENNAKKYISREIFYGTQSRSFYVGNIDQSLIKANFNNGILEVTVPKEQLPIEDKTNYIAID